MELRSYLNDEWKTGTGDGRGIVDATSGETVATVSAGGLDLASAYAHGREVGGPAIRRMTFAERGRMLKAMAGIIHENRELLIDVSRQGGTTRGDAKFDIDGATGTLAAYAAFAKGLPDTPFLADGPGIQLSRSPRFRPMTPSSMTSRLNASGEYSPSSQCAAVRGAAVCGPSACLGRQPCDLLQLL